VLNAANEIAVEAFLAGRIRYLDIAEVLRKVLDRHTPRELDHIDVALRADLWGRDEARRVICEAD
jgi:1-deoxy-D-xylulose-5-phosphate reductoisomerase